MEDQSKVIEELIESEETYTAQLRKAIEDWMNIDLGENQSPVFRNLEEILEQSKNFLNLLTKSSRSAKEVAQMFIEAEPHLLHLYQTYSKNKQNSDNLITTLSNLVKKEDQEVDGLENILNLPIEQLYTYKLYLERLKIDKHGTRIDEALNVVENIVQKTKSCLEIGSIKHCDVNLDIGGSFLIKNSFNILVPKRFTSTVFLFENILILTEENPTQLGFYSYVDSIALEDLGFAKIEHEEKIFHLTDYSDFKRVVPKYILEAQSEDIKMTWTRTIEAMLWKQVEKARGQKKQAYTPEKMIQLNKNQNKTKVCFIQKLKAKTKKNKSTFYL